MSFNDAPDGDGNNTSGNIGGGVIKSGTKGANRTCRVETRFTPAEKSDLDAVSSRWNMTVSEVLRYCFSVVAKGGVFEKNSDAGAVLRDLLNELQVQGRNLNQIAKAVSGENGSRVDAGVLDKIEVYGRNAGMLEDRVAEILMQSAENMNAVRGGGE